MDTITKDMSVLMEEDSDSSQDKISVIDMDYMESDRIVIRTSSESVASTRTTIVKVISMSSESDASTIVIGTTESEASTHNSPTIVIGSSESEASTHDRARFIRPSPRPTRLIGNTTESESLSDSSVSTRSSKKQRGASLNNNQTMKFLENFDPERSNRERKKLTRQITSSGKKKPTMYDDKGVMIGADVDLCDCLEEDCPGCHFPCPKCHSNKCGHDCRQNRRWTYEEMWGEGSMRIKANPMLGLK